MAFPRKRNALQFTEPELRKLESIRRSRTEEKRRTVRAAVLLDSLSGQSDEAIAQRLHTSRSTVVLCIQKCLQFGLEAGLGELPRTGKPRQLPDDAIAWVQNCACQKPKELGYSYELWTYKLLTAHVHGSLSTSRYLIEFITGISDVSSGLAPLDSETGVDSSSLSDQHLPDDPYAPASALGIAGVSVTVYPGFLRAAVCRRRSRLTALGSWGRVPRSW